MEEGQLVDERFRILATAGRGAMGTVYRAADTSNGDAIVALKMLDAMTDLARFQAEVDALQRASHPGIVTYVAHGSSKDRTFVVMEWLDGTDLEHVLQGGARMAVTDAAEMGAQVAEALDFLHRRGMIHRDVKPGNIFLRGADPGQPKLLDLGIARRLDEPSRITHRGAIVGTPAYMSPEGALGNDDIDGRSDIFSLGCVLYEAVTARPPFDGEHAVHVLAKILVDDPVPPSRVVPEIEPRMEEAILAMLQKDPGLRPSAAQARKLLERVGGPSSRYLTPLTLGERRVVSVLLTSAPSVTADTVQERDAVVADAHVRAAVARHRGTLITLPHSAILATFGGPGAPSDHAARAAECALDLGGWIGAAHTAIVTARPEASGREGSLADRASQLLKQAKKAQKPTILVDPASEPLLSSRFALEQTPFGIVLRSAKPALSDARTLRGRPTRCVGRDVELAMLLALVREVAEDRVSRVARVVGDAGMGKSRLLYEVVKQARLIRFLTARGESTTAFSVAGQLIRQAAGIEHGCSPADAARRLDIYVAARFSGPFAASARETIGEVSQVPVDAPSAALTAARGDPAIMGDAIRRVFVAWLEAEAARAPLGLIVEDMHWADVPSLALLAAGARALRDRPLLVMGSSRPGPTGDTDNPWGDLEPREVRLGKLSRAPAERYVRDLVPEAPPTTVDFIVARAGGHPFYLEDLVRALLEGVSEGVLADTALGMLEARFDNLDPTVRRVLRAASTFGPVFRADAAAVVLGGPVGGALRDLVQAELVEPLDPASSPVHRYRFRHALIRDAAYAGLTEADRKLAHRRAAVWLRDQGDGDAAIVAGHFAEAGDLESAAPFYQRSAELALEGNDYQGALGLARRALDATNDEARRGSLELLAGEASFWVGDTTSAAAYAGGAVARLAAGTVAWFHAVALATAAAGQLGDNAAVRRWLELAQDTHAQLGASDAQLICVARGTSQLLWAHLGWSIEAHLEKFDRLAQSSGAMGPLAAGWVHRVRGEREMVRGRFAETFAHFDRSVAALVDAGAIRMAAFQRLTLGAVRAAAGDYEHARADLAEGKAAAAIVGAPLVQAYGRLANGIALALSQRPIEAEAELRGALVGLRGNARLSFVTQLYLSLVRERQGDLAGAAAEARAAAGQLVGTYLRQTALGQWAHVTLALGYLADAETIAEGIDAGAPELGESDLFAGLAAMGKAETLWAQGRKDEARTVLRRFIVALRGWAETFPPALRAAYLEREHPNRAVLALARAWGVEVDG